jgi:hypothetical protein
VNYFDIVPGKAGAIEGEYRRQSVRSHGRYESGIMGRLARHVVLNDELFANGIHAVGIGEKFEYAFQSRHFDCCRGRGQSEAILFHRTRRDDPELDQILRSNVQISPVSSQGLDGRTNGFQMRVPSLQRSKQYIGVEEHPGQPWSG